MLTPFCWVRFSTHASPKLSTGIWKKTSRDLNGKLKGIIQRERERDDFNVTPTHRTRPLCPPTRAASLSVNKIKQKGIDIYIEKQGHWTRCKLFNVNVPAGELRSFYLVQYQFKFRKNTIQIQGIYHRDRIQSLEPKLMHLHGSVSKVILQDNWHRRRKSPKHRNNNVQEKPKNQCLFFKRTMRQCLKQTSVQSAGKKRETFVFFFYYVFSLWVLRETVECISWISNEITGIWLNSRSSAFLVSERLTP